MSTVSPEKCQEVIAKAERLYQSSSDWTAFFRAVLGVGGIVRTTFNDPRELAAFEKSEQYQEIQEMLAKLRERTTSEADDQEPTKVITVRLPKCLHESLRSEAYERKTSMNKLCISKLLQIIDGKLVPTDAPARGNREENSQVEQPTYAGRD